MRVAQLGFLTPSAAEPIDNLAAAGLKGAGADAEALFKAFPSFGQGEYVHVHGRPLFPLPSSQGVRG